MRKVKVSAVQMKCTTDVWENIANAEKFVRQAKDDGANIVLLPELFERQYFCQERRYDYYNFAKPTLETAKFWVYTVRLTFPTTIIIRKNFTLFLVIRGSKLLKLSSVQSV